jgi:DnaK suppressor protein
VKAKTAKVKVSAKATKTVKVVKTAAKAKPRPAVKAPVKATAKPPQKAKSLPKSGSKAVAKAVATQKIVKKAAPARKAAPVKASAKVSAALPKRKPVEKVAPKLHKSASAKTARPAVKVKPKVAKPSTVKTAKPAAKVKTKDSVNKTIEKPAKSQAIQAKQVPVPTAAKTAPVAPVAANSGVPARAGRPSSRLAQLTVPSMAQSVASTAAKASFTQTLASPMIVPPLASAIKKDARLANNWKSKSIEQLSDAELIAMPDAEYMNEFQMTFFRRRLVQLKKDILSNAGETTEHLREDTVVVPDPADRATIEEEHALELRTRDRERKLLKKIEQSIARIDAGDYGYCDETGEPIGVGRLLARPTANLSLEAQQRRELKQKMFGD